MNLFFTAEHADIAFRLFSAAFLGGLIGLERELHRKEAGLRTYSIVCLGSALMMVVSTQMYEIYKASSPDPGRIAAQVVSGVGFLGAGAIIRFSQGGVKGLTTAAGVWTAAGIGLACGMRQYFAAVLTTFFVLAALIIFSRIDRYVEGRKRDEAFPS